MKGLLLCHVVPQRYRERRRRGGEFLFRETIARRYVNFWGFIIKFEAGEGWGGKELRQSAVKKKKKCADLQKFGKRGGCVFTEILIIKWERKA